MRASKRWLRLLALLMAFGLVAVACGGDGDDEDASASETDASASEASASEADDSSASASEADDGEAMEDGAGLPTEGSVEVAAGTVLNLDECEDWSATQGVDGDEIRLGWSGPESGTLAAFGAIGEGMQFYFDSVNDTDPIDGKEIVLITRDDAYEAGRTVANIEEMIEADDIFAFVHLIGTPNNLAARPITDEACVPQLFNSSGFPFWGDPANFPWNVGNILNYVTETEIWCQAIVDEFGEGATVAALIMNNDFGTTYLNTLKDSPACSGVELVEEQLHDPAAPDITNEMTTMIASDADVLVAGTTSGFCSQATAILAGSEWRPRFYLSYTCNNLSSFFVPVAAEAITLSSEGSAPTMANSNKICGDPIYADDPAVQEVERILDEYGGVTCADGSFSTGVLYGQFVEDVLRDAAAMEGGLNRVNLMAAVWNADTSNDLLLGGTLKLDGVNDAYWTEAAQLQEVTDDGSGGVTFTSIGDFIDFEGQGGSFGG
ncbi:MAG: ABC transporter substrate-binding protein [Actinomycetota bacterium]